MSRQKQKKNNGKNWHRGGKWEKADKKDGQKPAKRGKTGNMGENNKSRQKISKKTWQEPAKKCKNRLKQDMGKMGKNEPQAMTKVGRKQAKTKKMAKTSIKIQNGQEWAKTGETGNNGQQ